MSNRKRARKALSMATSAALTAGLLGGLATSSANAAVVEGFTDVSISKGLRAGVEQYTSIFWYEDWNGDAGNGYYYQDLDISYVEIQPLVTFNFNSTDGLPSAVFDAGYEGDNDDWLGGSYSEYTTNDWDVNLKEWPTGSQLQNSDFAVVGSPNSATNGSYGLIVAPNYIDTTGTTYGFGDDSQESYGDALTAGKYVINVRDEISGFNTDFTIMVGGTPTRGTLTAERTALPIGWESKMDLALFDAAGVPTSFDPDRNESYYLEEIGGDIYAEGDTTGYEDFDFAKGSYDDIYFMNDEVGTARVWAEVDLEAGVEFDSNSVNIVTKGWVSEVGDCSTGATAATGVAVRNYPDTCQNDDVFIRSGVTSVNLYYNGGTDNADRYVGIDGQFPVLTNASGVANFPVSMVGVAVEDTKYVDFYTWYWNGGSYSVDTREIDLNVEAAGFAPHYELQNTALHYNDDERDSDDWNHEDFNNSDYNWYAKSLLAGQDFTVSFKATDIWGTPIRGLSTVMEGSASGLVENKLNITELNGVIKETDANGVVSFNVENDLTAADLVDLYNFNDYDGSNDDGNEQEPVRYTYAWAEFNAMPVNEYEGPYSSDILYHEYLRDLTPSVEVYDSTVSSDAIYVPVNGIDDSGSGQTAVFAYIGIENIDGFWIYGVPVNIASSANGFVAAGPDMDIPSDVHFMSPSASFISGWDDIYAYMTNTKVGAASFTASAGASSATFNQAFKTDASFARYLTAVNPAVSVEAGEIAKAEFHVTDRFANPISGINVNMVGNILGAGAVSATTDANGKVAVDVTTPVKLAVAQLVTATATGAQFVAPANSSIALPAGVGSATVTVSSAETPKPLPTIKVVGVKGAARVWVYGADAGDVVRTTIDGKVKAVRVLKAVNSLKVYKLAAGKHTIKLRVITDRGTVTKTVKVTVKR